MKTFSLLTWSLFAAALFCYLASWTAVGAGLGFLGMLIEFVARLSASADE
jgi:hypothetical protein